MKYIITKRDLINLNNGEKVNLYTKDSKGYHWVADTLQLDEVQE